MAEQTKKKSKFKLGRNLGTFLLLIGTIVIVALMAIWISNIASNWGTSVTAFTTKPENLTSSYLTNPDELKRMSLSDYNNLEDKPFDITLKATKYEDGTLTGTTGDKITFSLSFAKCETTPEQLLVISSTAYIVTACIGICDDWVGEEAYSSYSSTSSSSNFSQSYVTNTTAKTFTVTTNNSYPQSKGVWPFRKTVGQPTAYLYFAYKTYVNAKATLFQYVITYNFNDYYISGTTTGGIA